MILRSEFCYRTEMYFIDWFKFGLVIWFNGISTLDGYLMLNPVYIYVGYRPEDSFDMPYYLRGWHNRIRTRFL